MDIHSYIEQSTSQRQNTVYLRSYERNIPSNTLQPYLDFRPVMTKYSILPIVDLRTPILTPLVQQSTYIPEKNFNPGNDSGPWSGYASNVNHESELRNQFFAIQKCSQSEYIPSSKSNLYKINWTNKKIIQQPFPNLFQNEIFSSKNCNPNSEKIGFSLFNNATRQQIKDLTDQKLR